MRPAIFLASVFISFGGLAQSASERLLSINTQIDEAVVKKDTLKLKRLYAEDFVFTHGTGLVDGKTSWIKNVADTNTHFVLRVQDSTTVELHGDVALVMGKIEIVRKDKDGNVGYGIWYIRVYRKKKKDLWQMISHRTTREWHH